MSVRNAVASERVVGVVGVGTSGVDTGMVARRGVVGIGDAVAGQGVMSVVSVVAETGTGGTSSTVTCTMLLMSTKLAILLKPIQNMNKTTWRVERVETYGTTSDGVSSRRRVGSGLVAGQGVVGVGNAVARQRVVSVVLGTGRGVRVLRRERSDRGAQLSQDELTS